MRIRLWLLILVTSARAQTPFTAPDVAPEFHEIQASSLYVPMRDGVRIAIDVLLPKPLAQDKKLPALFKIARFGRSATDGAVSAEDRFWVQHGYARILIDERGTGASFGTSRYGTDTIPDLYDLVAWVVKQPWSNGRVGAIGVSVEGTAAELLAATNHPAVRAVAPWFSDYNYYTDLVRPGGIFNEWILKTFEDFTVKMDSGASAKRVDGDPEAKLLKQAVAEHRNNLNIYTATKSAAYIDDPLDGARKSLLDISIPGANAALRKSSVPMLIFASWYDAGTVQGTIQRFRDFSNSQTIFLGAWSHGANSNADPFFPDAKLQPSRAQQWLEALQFFDRYLKQSPAAADSPRRFFYYTIGNDEWRSTDVWPPAGLHKTSYSLHPDGTLDSEVSSGESSVTLRAASIGERNRWHTQFGGGPVDYSAAVKEMTALASFQTEPLSGPLNIVGQPVLRLRISCAADDPSIIAYLVAVDPQDRLYYLTEGHLRFSQRKIDDSQATLHSYWRRDSQPVPRNEEFDAELTLFPTSALLSKGFRLRLLLASGDSATFGDTPQYRATISAQSKLELLVQ